MTTHAAIMAQLEKYDGGKFRPYSPTQLYINGVPSGEEQWLLSIRDDGVFQWKFGPLAESTLTHYAHLAIERAAFRAVMHYVEQLGYAMCVGKSANAGTVAVSGVRAKVDGMMDFLWLKAEGPDEPAMWLAAMKYLNGERA